MPQVTGRPASPLASTGSSTLQPRELPANAPATITVGSLTAKKESQSADVVRYSVEIAGRTTFIDVMAKYDPRTAPKAPPGFLSGRKDVLLTDRDGVVNKATAFLNSPADVTDAVMIPGALQGIAELNRRQVGLVMVTNQGGYQAGKMSFENALAVNVRVAEKVAAAGGHVDGIVICPFVEALKAPPRGVVDARKPASGMPKHVVAMATEARVKVLGMAGDQRSDGAAAQGAKLKFFAVVDEANGRWDDEVETARRRNEPLATVKRGATAYEEISDLGALARRQPTGRGRTTSDESTFETGSGRATSSRGVAAAAARTLAGAQETSALPARWLQAATEAVYGPVAEATGDSTYDYRVALHGDAALKLARQATTRGIPAFDESRELAVVSVHGHDELEADVFAFDVVSGRLRTLGSIGNENLEDALAWDGFKTPTAFERAVLLPTSTSAWDSGDELAGFEDIKTFRPQAPLDPSRLVKLGPSQQPALGPVEDAFSGAPRHYALALQDGGATLAIRSGTASHAIRAAPGTTFTQAGWSTQASVEKAVKGFAHPGLDREGWNELNGALEDSDFGLTDARPLLWLKQSDGATRFLAFSGKPDRPALLEVNVDGRTAVQHDP